MEVHSRSYGFLLLLWRLSSGFLQVFAFYPGSRVSWNCPIEVIQGFRVILAFLGGMRTILWSFSRGFVHRKGVFSSPRIMELNSPQQHAQNVAKQHDPQGVGKWDSEGKPSKPLEKTLELLSKKYRATEKPRKRHRNTKRTPLHENPQKTSK